MNYHYRDASGARAGPYTAEELRQLHLSGAVKPDTEVFEGDAATTVPFREVWPRLSAGPASAATAGVRSTLEDLTSRTTDDIRALIPHLLVPLQDIRTLKWIGDRRLLAIAIIGLLPLFLLVVFADKGEVKAAYWGLALYVSVLWAVFFYYIFPAPRVTLRNCVICFFTTGIVSIAVLLLAYEMPPLNWLVGFTRSWRSFPARLFGYIFGVGVPEELCKALVLFFLARRRVLLPPQALLFYGLISGLGFGIYEGIGYQTGRNFDGTKASYYLNNMLRLTSLPFLHAIWTGIAGYFIGFAYQYPRRKSGLLVIAIGLPALLHGLYDVFADNVLGLVLALVSVLALYLYLAKSVYFESVLAGKQTASTPPPVEPASPPTSPSPPPAASP